VAKGAEAAIRSSLRPMSVATPKMVIAEPEHDARQDERIDVGVWL
jgi:hypothetical protein